MTTPRSPFSSMRLTAFACATCACIAFACELPRPTSPRAPTTAALSSVVPGAISSLDSGGQIDANQVRAMLGADRLSAMRRATGHTQVVYVIDSAGGSRRAIVRGAGTAAENAALSFTNAAMVVLRFAPGLIAADTTTVAWVRIGAQHVAARDARASLDAPRASVRGTGALQPGLDSVLVLIDGRVAGRGHAAFDSLDPGAIASMDVLKGSAATERFGKAGAAGAIVIARKASTAR